MCKELTVFVVLLLCLTADIIWLGQTERFGFGFSVLTGIGVVVTAFMILVGEKYLVRRLRLRRAALSVLVSRSFRSLFRPDLSKLRTPWREA